MSSSDSNGCPDDSSRKRKERDDNDGEGRRAEPTVAGGSPLPEPNCEGRLVLAGCLAHEFLTRGTILGRRWGPPKGAAGHVLGEEGVLRAEVACVFMGGGVHVPGVVNPTQLASWLGA